MYKYVVSSSVDRERGFIIKFKGRNGEEFSRSKAGAASFGFSDSVGAAELVSVGANGRARLLTSISIEFYHRRVNYEKLYGNSAYWFKTLEMVALLQVGPELNGSDRALACKSRHWVIPELTVAASSRALHVAPAQLLLFMECAHAWQQMGHAVPGRPRHRSPVGQNALFLQTAQPPFPLPSRAVQPVPDLLAAPPIHPHVHHPLLRVRQLIVIHSLDPETSDSRGSHW